MPHSAPVDGFSLAYDRSGTGEPVILLHGWPGDRTDYRVLGPALALGSGCDVIVPDLRGFGQSDKHRADPAEQYSPSAQARSVAGLIRELLPVVDNLERALGAIEADNGVAQGLKLVYAELEGVLTRNGVQAMEPKGQPFDPTVHEAISTMPAEDAGSGTVVDVVEKGYKLGDTVIRPARVVVAA